MTKRLPDGQARLLAGSGITGIVVEYRVTAEGTTSQDAIQDGRDAVGWIRSEAARFGIDPSRVAVAGSSAGGALAVEASADAGAVVLYNPAVDASAAPEVRDAKTIVFHSREDTIVPFTSVDDFCTSAKDCALVGFDAGDHGFFNDDPAFSEVNSHVLAFLEGLGW